MTANVEDGDIEELRTALAEFDADPYVRKLWPVIDAARKIVTHHFPERG